MKKVNKYFIRSMKFIEFNDYGDKGGESYTYQISFNKSLEHTGKLKGIENGLNNYDRFEPWKDLFKCIIRMPKLLYHGFRNLL